MSTSSRSGKSAASTHNHSPDPAGAGEDAGKGAGNPQLAGNAAGLEEYLAAARAYLARGWQVVPLLPLRKGPEQKGWQHQRLSAEELRGWARRFAFDLPARSPNLGLLLGEPSGGLVDVDCDCAEARAAAALLLPPTARISERTSSLASHCWYVVTNADGEGDGAPTTAKFAWAGEDRRGSELPAHATDGLKPADDAVGEAPGGEADAAGGAAPLAAHGEGLGVRSPSHAAMLVELRSTGGQTVVPPSWHPSGERVRWRQGKAGEPGHVTGGALRRAVARVAAAALIARHWPGVGLRDEAALALAGMLLRGGWSEPETDTFCEAVAVAAHDEEASKRRKASGTAQRLAAGENVWGATALAERLRGDGEAVVRQARVWLGLRDHEPASPTHHRLPHAAIDCLHAPRESMGGEGIYGIDGLYRDRDRELPKVTKVLIEGRGVLAADVAAQATEWLWQGRIPRGAITLLDGDPGLGKSLITLDLAARVTRGLAMPDGSLGVAGGVVLLSAEDALTATIRPRLDAAGADLERVYILQTVRIVDTQTGKTTERGICLPDDTGIVEEAMERVGAALVVIDPLMAYLDAKVNSWRDQDVRAALAPLGRLAERTGAALLILRHLTKGGGSNAIYRGGGSIGIIGAARSGLLVAKSPDDPEHERILASSKSNLGPPMPALRYQLHMLDEQQVRVEWLGASEYTASALLSQPADGSEETLVAEAMAWLRERLADGARVGAKEIEQTADAGRFGGKPLYTASKRLHIHKQREGFGKGAVWYWTLPAAAPPAPNLDGTRPLIPSAPIDSLSTRRQSMEVAGNLWRDGDGQGHEQGHEEAGG